MISKLKRPVIYGIGIILVLSAILLACSALVPVKMESESKCMCKKGISWTAPKDPRGSTNLCNCVNYQVNRNLLSFAISQVQTTVCYYRTAI